jgi:hypothetical protein
MIDEILFVVVMLIFLILGFCIMLGKIRLGGSVNGVKIGLSMVSLVLLLAFARGCSDTIKIYTLLAPMVLIVGTSATVKIIHAIRGNKVDGGRVKSNKKGSKDFAKENNDDDEDSNDPDSDSGMGGGGVSVNLERVTGSITKAIEENLDGFFAEYRSKRGFNFLRDNSIYVRGFVKATIGADTASLDGVIVIQRKIAAVIEFRYIKRGGDIDISPSEGCLFASRHNWPIIYALIVRDDKSAMMRSEEAERKLIQQGVGNVVPFMLAADGKSAKVLAEDKLTSALDAVLKIGSKVNAGAARPWSASARTTSQHSLEVIANVQTVFPMTLFPHRIELDRTKVTIVRRTSPWSSVVVSIRIEDVLNVSCTLGMLFGSITVATRTLNTIDNFEIKGFIRSDVIRLKYLVEGCMIAKRRGINTDELSIHELTDTLQGLGEHADRNQ